MPTILKLKLSLGHSGAARGLDGWGGGGKLKIYRLKKNHRVSDTLIPHPGAFSRLLQHFVQRWLKKCSTVTNCVADHFILFHGAKKSYFSGTQ